MSTRDKRSIPTRCDWCANDPLYIEYHDTEWGVPVRDDQTLFEFLLLEGAQAGLSWITILRKREGYRALFSNFDAQRVAQYSDAQLNSLLSDASIIRNRLKVYGARQNARAFLDIQAQWGSFSDYMWHFVDGKPIQNTWRTLRDIPATTTLSNQISKDMKKNGFTFVGPTIIYAHMQATGMVNDHIQSCFRHRECAQPG